MNQRPADAGNSTRYMHIQNHDVGIISVRHDATASTQITYGEMYGLHKFEKSASIVD